jgi:hypothetical protein
MGSKELLACEPQDLLKLLLILMTDRVRQGQISQLPELAIIIAMITETGDLRYLAALSRVVWQLNLTPELVLSLDEVGFVTTYIKETVRLEVPKQFKCYCLLLNAILHICFVSSVLRFLPALLERMASKVIPESYALSLVVSYSFYMECHKDLTENWCLEAVARLNVSGTTQVFVKKLKDNMGTG